MLNKLRKFSETFFAKIFIGLIALSFAFWGISDFFRSEPKNIIAEVDGKEISLNHLINEINNLSKLYNFKNNKEAINNNLHFIALSNLISDKVLQSHIKQEGVIIDDISLSIEIKNTKEFQDNKNFSRSKYEKFLIERGVSSKILEEQIRTTLEKRIIQDTLKGFIPINNYYTKKVNEFYSESVDIEYVDLEKIELKASVKDNEIEEYFKKNKDNFKTKEFRVINFAELTTADLTGLNEVNNKFFEIIDKIENEISKGTEFNKILNIYKLKKTKNLVFSIDGISQEGTRVAVNQNIITKAFQLNKKNSSLIESSGKYFLINLENIIESKERKLDEQLKMQIKNIIVFDKKKENFDKIKKTITNKDYQIFVNFAKENNLFIQKKNIKNRFEKTFDNISINETIFNYPANKNYLIETNTKFLIANNRAFKKGSATEKVANSQKEATAIVQNKISALYDESLRKKYKIIFHEKNMSNFIKNI
ncbi:MAG: SurA N-terminal domain-containing protein [Candidatus Fonsibacter sp.]